MTHFHDPGLQNERTALAWQRTALSLMVAGLLLSRLAFAKLGWLALLAALVALPLAGWVFLASRAKYSSSAGLRARQQSRGGRSAAALSLVVVALGGVELVVLLG